MTEESTAKQRALEARAPELSAFIERLAERLGTGANTRIAFAEPVEKGDVVVIPVARIRYGFGGGGGGGRGARPRPGEAPADEEGAAERPARADEGYGYGGGGGLQAVPVGYIEIRAGRAAFSAFPDPAAEASRFAARGLAAGLGLWLAFRGLRGVVRALLA